MEARSHELAFCCLASARSAMSRIGSDRDDLEHYPACAGWVLCETWDGNRLKAELATVRSCANHCRPRALVPSGKSNRANRLTNLEQPPTLVQRCLRGLGLYAIVER